MRWFFIFFALVLPGMPILTAMAAESGAPVTLDTAGDVETDDSGLAERYLRAGDELLGDNQLERAADAYERSLSLGSSSLAVAERLRMAQHLAAVGRLDPAIETLRSILREQPDDLDIRIDLARYLSWNNELLEAASEAEQILQQDPGNRAALQVRANAASWRGDFGTALPIYRQLLSVQEDFDTRLNYTHALVGNGQIEEARESRDLLAASNAPQEQKLAALDRRIKRHRPPRVLAGASRYRDSDKNDRNEYRLGAGLSLGNLDFTVEAEEVRTSDRLRSLNVKRLRLTTAMWPAMDWLSLNAGVGVAVVDDTDRDTYPIGYLGAEGVRGRLRFHADLEREVFDETAQVLSNRIRKTRARLFSSFQYNDRWRLDANTEYENFSDDNHGWNVELTPQYALRIANPGLRLGYRRVQAGFDRQSGSGYFDPSRLHSNLLVFFATLFGERLQGDVEIYAGRQSTERFDTHQQDDIIGGSGRLAVEISRHLRVETELEGGNFSLQSSDGFNYYLLSVNVIGSF